MLLTPDSVAAEVAPQGSEAVTGRRQAGSRPPARRVMTRRPRTTSALASGCRPPAATPAGRRTVATVLPTCWRPAGGGSAPTCRAALPSAGGAHAVEFVKPGLGSAQPLRMPSTSCSHHGHVLVARAGRQHCGPCRTVAFVWDGGRRRHWRRARPAGHNLATGMVASCALSAVSEGDRPAPASAIRPFPRRTRLTQYTERHHSTSPSAARGAGWAKCINSRESISR
jgi:hypothetical protein